MNFEYNYIYVFVYLFTLFYFRYLLFNGLFKRCKEGFSKKDAPEPLERRSSSVSQRSLGPSRRSADTSNVSRELHLSLRAR